MSDLLARIDRFLAEAQPAPEPAAPPVDETVRQVAERLKAALSGAFAEAVEVALGEGPDAGAYFARVPARLLKASGIRFVESVAPQRAAGGDRGAVQRVAVGSPEAATNAANRVAKPLGEGWRVALDSYVPAGGAVAEDEVVFRVDKAA